MPCQSAKCLNVTNSSRFSWIISRAMLFFRSPFFISQFLAALKHYFLIQRHDATHNIVERREIALSWFKVELNVKNNFSRRLPLTLDSTRLPKSGEINWENQIGFFMKNLWWTRLSWKEWRGNVKSKVMWIKKCELKSSLQKIVLKTWHDMTMRWNKNEACHPSNEKEKNFN
jgi:hypothetical protein